jgi:FK506-binding protein 1
MNCRVCKKSYSQARCDTCQQVYYCCDAHKKQDAAEHEDLCRAIKQAKQDGVYKWKVLKQGDGNIYPKDRDTVTIHYRVQLMSGDSVDSSYDRNDPFTLQLGRPLAIKGMEHALKQISLHERSVFIISSDQAFGSHGFPPLVPPNAFLECTEELIAIRSSSHP